MGYTLLVKQKYMREARPTIKGVFVKSHLHSLEVEKGERALEELHKRFGRSIEFKNMDNVPVADEVEILEHIVAIRSPEIAREDRALEAGRLHFRNFTKTPLGRLIVPLIKTNVKAILMQSRNIAGHVFHGVHFSAADVGPNAVRITMTNNDYPIEHFKGFFKEWLAFADYEGEIDAQTLSRGVYQYLISWKPHA